MTTRIVAKILVCSCLSGGAFVYAADDTEPAIRRPSVGVRMVYFGDTLFSTSTLETSTTKPVADYTYTGSSHSPRKAISPSLEYRLTEHLSLGVELHFHHAQYQQTTAMVSGIKDPNSSYDDRKTTTIQESTQANYWEFPFVVRYYGNWRNRRLDKIWLNKIYLAGGLEWRHVGRVRTGTEYSYADGTTDYNENPAQPAHANRAGVVAGFGYRIMDAYRIKLTPEVRLVRWQGSTFQGTSYQSRLNQLEISVGLSY